MPGTVSEVSATLVASTTRLPVWEHRTGERRIAGLVSVNALLYQPGVDTAKPVADYVRKGGVAAEAEGRLCVCNGLVSTIGLAQIRPDGSRERPLVTAGNDVAIIASFLPPGRNSYSAAEVIQRLREPAR